MPKSAKGKSIVSSFPKTVYRVTSDRIKKCQAIGETEYYYIFACTGSWGRGTRKEAKMAEYASYFATFLEAQGWLLGKFKEERNYALAKARDLRKSIMQLEAMTEADCKEVP